MSIWENVLLAFSGLKSSKMRSMLTMLGIIIGIASVIAIVTVGNSLTSSITSMMDELGANQIYAFVSSKEANSNKRPQERDYITDEMIEKLKEQMGDDVMAVINQEAAGAGQAKDGRKYANVNISGVTAGALKESNITILKGHDILEREVLRGSRHAVVSTRFVEKMFQPGVDPLGKEIKVHTTSYGVQTYTITGIYEFKMPAFMANFVSDEDLSSDMYVPLTAAKRLTSSADGHTGIAIKFPPDRSSQEIDNKIREFFANEYRSNTQFEVLTQNMEGMMSQFTTLLGTLAIAISIIAGISLLVGGIGVMNIMLVSVTERTREIGTRKALGARNSAIKGQFIIEAMILCLVGGVIGVALGLAMGYIGAAILKFPAKLDIPIIAISVLSSMAIGVFFGYYPASKAAKLDPIEALRYE